ncbi:MAG TPA: amidohydrolase family protein [Verrucomicrobiae bacterium]|jgi:predicted TIM-barrel fold metal-dependent hydrolase|nr:amidohydrolase family protein [Verrucomicrobiae bacterium]
MATQVVDTDGHIFERDQDIAEYMEAPYRGRKELLTLPFFPTLDGFQRMARRVADGRPYVVGPDDPKSWFDVLDREGLDRAVIYPTAGLAEGFIQDSDWAVVVCRAYNNMMSERYIKYNRRLNVVALLPIQDIQEAAKELRRCVKELHMVGGVIAPVGFPTPLGDRYFDPLYAEAEKLGRPLAIHGAPSRGLGFDFFRSLIEARALSHPFAQMIALTSVILEGVPERFPKLRIASLEAGCAWLPFLMDRLDMEYKHRPHQAPLLKKSPSEYMRSGQIYYHTELWENMLPVAIDRLGEDLFLYASDYPHEADLAEAIREFEARKDLSDTAKRKILSDNGKRFYSMEG